MSKIIIRCYKHTKKTWTNRGFYPVKVNEYKLYIGNKLITHMTDESHTDPELLLMEIARDYLKTSND